MDPVTVAVIAAVLTTLVAEGVKAVIARSSCMVSLNGPDVGHPAVPVHFTQANDTAGESVNATQDVVAETQPDIASV